MKYSILFALKSLFDTDGINMDLWTLNDLPDGNPLAQVSEAPLLGETAATTPAAPLIRPRLRFHSNKHNFYVKIY